MTYSLKTKLTALSVGVALAFGLSARSYAQTDGAMPKAETVTQTDAAANGGATGSSDGSPIEGEMPRNAVGDKFELPRYSEGNQVELITGLCGIQMKDMTKEACGCIAERSLDALSDPQRDYMIATVVAPPVADRMIGDGRVGEPDQKKIFAFLNSEADACKAKSAQSGESLSAPAGENAALPEGAETPEDAGTSDGAN